MGGARTASAWRLGALKALASFTALASVGGALALPASAEVTAPVNSAPEALGRASAALSNMLGARSTPPCEPKHATHTSGGAVVLLTGAPVHSADSPMTWACATPGRGQATVQFQPNRFFAQHYTNPSDPSDSVGIVSGMGVAGTLINSAFSAGSGIVVPPGGTIKVSVAKGQTKTIRIEGMTVASGVYQLISIIDLFVTIDDAGKFQPGLLTQAILANPLLAACGEAGNLVRELRKGDPVGTLGRTTNWMEIAQGCADGVLRQGPYADPKLQAERDDALAKVGRGLDVVGKLLKAASLVQAGLDWVSEHWQDGIVTLTYLPERAVVQSEGHSYLWENGYLAHIPTTKDLGCRAPEWLPRVPVSWDVIDDNVLPVGIPATCSDLQAVRGKLVKRPGSTEAVYVDTTGWIHEVPGSREWDCHGGGNNLITTADWTDVMHMAKGEPAECIDVREGVVLHQRDGGFLDVDTRRSVLVAKGPTGGLVRMEIQSGGVFDCLKAQNHPVIDSPRYKIEELPLGGVATARCFPWDLEDTVIEAVAPDGNHAQWLVFATGEGSTARTYGTGTDHVPGRIVRTWMPSSVISRCLTGRKFKVVEISYTKAMEIEMAQRAEVLPCLNPDEYHGKLLESPDHRQYLVWQGRRHWVRDGGTSRCLTVWEHREVQALSDAYINSIPEAGGEWASCSTGVAEGTILRVSSTGAAFRAHLAGDGVMYLSPVTEAETYRCLIAKGAPLMDNLTQGHIEAFVMGQTNEPVCLNASAFAGKVVKGPDGWSGYVSNDGMLHHIASGGIFRCLTTWGGVEVHPETLSRAQLDAFGLGTEATCGAHQVARGKVIRNPSGHAVYIDADLVAHNIGTAHAYQCLVEVGVEVINVSSHDHLEAFAYGLDQPGCEKVLSSTTGASYYQDASGVLHWLRNTQSYYCAVDKGYRLQTGVSQGLIDSLKHGAWFSDCLSPSRYRNTMIRRSDGTVWVVDELDRRRWVPDGYSFECYAERGYRLVESNLTHEQSNSISEVGRMGHCLARWQANGTIIRECGGTSYYVENSQRRWIPSGWSFETVQSWGRPVLNWCLNWEHIGSLPETSRMPYMLPVWRFRDVLVHHHSGAVFKTDGNGCRRWVQDWYTVERLNELGVGFAGWNVNDEEINSLSYCGWHGRMIPEWRVRGRVVRAPTGHCYWVDDTGWWHYINTGDLYWYWVRKTGPHLDFAWDQIDSIRHEGSWAGYW